jgi:acetylornithine aminotransferase
MAKGMGNGFPIGGLLISSKFEAKKGILGTTFGGNHLACAAAIAVLDVLKAESLVENAADMGNYLKQELSEINGITEIRGRGLMLGIEFLPEFGAVRNRLFLKAIFLPRGKKQCDASVTSTLNSESRNRYFYHTT